MLAERKTISSKIKENGATNLNPPPIPAPATMVPLPSILAAASIVNFVGFDAIKSIIVPCPPAGATIVS